MMPLPLDFVLIPNAEHGLPTIGHLWCGAYNRIGYLRQKITQWKFESPIEVRWGIIFDRASKPEYEDAFLEMYDWLGWKPDFVHRIKEFFENPGYHPLCELFKFAPWKGGKPGPFPATLARLWHLRTVGKLWRGRNLMDLGGFECEMAGMYQVGIPVTTYIPTLLADGFCPMYPGNDDINSSTGYNAERAGYPYPYFVTPELMKRDPYEVLRHIHRMVFPEADETPQPCTYSGSVFNRREEEQFRKLSYFAEVPQGNECVIPSDWAKGLDNA